MALDNERYFKGTFIYNIHHLLPYITKKLKAFQNNNIQKLTSINRITKFHTELPSLISIVSELWPCTFFNNSIPNKKSGLLRIFEID